MHECEQNRRRVFFIVDATASTQFLITQNAQNRRFMVICVSVNYTNSIQQRTGINLPNALMNIMLGFLICVHVFLHISFNLITNEKIIGYFFVLQCRSAIFTAR